MPQGEFVGTSSKEPQAHFGSQEPKPIQPRYTAYETPYGLVIEIDGYTLGSLLAQPFFKKEWLDKSLGSLEIILEAEKITQQTLKNSGPRTHSGLPAYYHILRVNRRLMENAAEIDVKLDGGTIIPAVLHDEIEEKLKKLSKLWEQYTVLSRRETHPRLRKMYEVLRDISEARLSERREEIREDLEEKLFRVIPEYVRGSHRYRMRREIEKGTTNTIRLTRFFERYKYPESMEFQFSRYGNEGLEQTFGRSAIKFSDGTENMEEIYPLPYGTLGQLALAFEDQRQVGRFIIRQELTDKFGGVNTNARRMLPSNMVQTAFVRLFQFHYFNETLNQYSKEVLEGGNQEIIDLYRLAMHSRDIAINTAVRLLGTAREEFEKRPEIREIIPQVDRYIEDKLASDYWVDSITWDGVILKLVEYDVRGRKFIEEEDSKVGDSNINGMRFMYKAARVLEVLMPRFKMFYEGTRRQGVKPSLINAASLYDQNRHRRFTMRNMDEALTTMMPMRDMVAEYKVPDSTQ